jgi:hypothetical protein
MKITIKREEIDDERNKVIVLLVGHGKNVYYNFKRLL